MDKRDTDRLLSELFKQNAPYVNDRELAEHTDAVLARRRRRRRKTRVARVVSIAFASIVLAGGAAFGVFRAVEFFQSQPKVLIVDVTSAPGDTVTGAGSTEIPALRGKLPVFGTARLAQVKNEGTTDESPTNGVTWTRGRVEVYRISMSQPAASGTMEVTYDIGARADSGADIQGSWILTNSQGTWASSLWTGTVSPDGVEQFAFGNANGAGGFEGLLLLMQWHVLNNPIPPRTATTISTEPIAVSGWIQSAK